MFDIVSISMSVFDKLLSKTPDYDQKRSRDYEQLKLEYKREKEGRIVDHARLADLRDSIMCHIRTESRDL